MFVKKNVEFDSEASFGPFRKIAMGTWRNAKDPSVYGLLEIEMSTVLEMMPEYSRKHGVKITPSHLVGKAISYCLKRRPEINGMIRWGRPYLRKHVSLFYQVNISGERGQEVKKAMLSGCSIHQAENLKLREIAQQLEKKSAEARQGKNEELSKNVNLIQKIPWPLTGLYLDIASWLLYCLNISVPGLLPKDPFGSVMITNIGSLGLDVAWAPLCPYSRVPMLLTVGKITPRPWVVDGQVVVRPIMPIGVTFDHRFIDGVHAAQMSADFKKCFEMPEKYLFLDEGL